MEKRDGGGDNEDKAFLGVSAALTLLVAMIAAGLLLLFGLAIPTQVQSNTITVNTTDDESTPSDGKCSLREAIQNANDNLKSFPECKAGSGEDKIVFSDKVRGDTITLDPVLGQLTVTDAAELSIDGGKGIRASP